MRCPKCGLTSFDYNEACPNCGRNLSPIREELGLLDVAPQPLFLLGSLLGQKEPGEEDFTFEPSEAEHLGTYDGDSSGIQEEEVSVADMEEVATLEFEADLEEEDEGAGLEIPPEGEIEFEIPGEESSLDTEGAEVETPDQPLDLAAGEQTLVLEPEDPTLKLELEAETQVESSGQEIENLDLGLEPADEAEPLKAEGDDLGQATLDLEPEDLDLSDIEPEMEEAETSDFGAPDKIPMVKPDDLETELEIKPVEKESENLELNLDSAVEDKPLRTKDDELDLAALDLEPEGLDLSDIELETEDAETTGFGDSDDTLIIEPEETPGDEKELDLPGLNNEEKDLLTKDEDELDDQALTASAEAELDDLESHLEDSAITEDTDESLILEESGESGSPIFQESDDEEDLDDIELDFDDLELELEEDN